MFRPPLCSSLPHHQRPPVNRSTSRLQSRRYREPIRFLRWVFTSTASPTMHKAHTEVIKTSMRSTLRRAPEALHKQSMLNFGRNVLAQPTRGGKRHNLASIIKKRTIQPCTADHEIVNHKTKSTDAATLTGQRSLGQDRGREHPSCYQNRVFRR